MTNEQMKKLQQIDSANLPDEVKAEAKETLIKLSATRPKQKKKVYKTVSMPMWVHDLLKKEAKKRGLPIGNMCTKLILDAFLESSEEDKTTDETTKQEEKKNNKKKKKSSKSKKSS